MGNKACICCEQIGQAQTQVIDIEVIKKKNTHQNEDSNVSNQLPNDEHKNIEVIVKPTLLSPVEQNLKKHQPFQNLIKKEQKLQKYGQDIYEGPTNQKKQPHGYGTMFYPNGAVFVGQFVNGIASGPAHYILPNGSYYRGQMNNNIATDQQAYFQSEKLRYQGGVKNNKFEGKGKQVGEDHQFEGIYKDGKRLQGTLKWGKKISTSQQSPMKDESPLKKLMEMSNKTEEEKEEYQSIFQGHFDQDGLFTGQGKLRSNKGTFEGNFIRGKKEGKGIFIYKNGLRYEGDYENDEKNGKGTIFKKQGAIAYSGEMKNGLPNGKGFIVNQHGKQIMMQWKQGISSNVKQQSKVQSNMKSQQKK